MKKIFITGANGFIGRALISLLYTNKEYGIIAGVREKSHYLAEKFPKVLQVVYNDIVSYNNWAETLKNVDVVIHLCALVHSKTKIPLAKYQQLNVNVTEHLLHGAIANKVKQFVMLSTAKVHGDKSDAPFTENSKLVPTCNYSKTKIMAEKLVKKTCESSGLKYTIIRPPLVYGKGVKANFYSLLKIAQMPIPLPLLACKNARSLIYIENLTDIIEQCLLNQAAFNQEFLVSDDFDVSTPVLIKTIRKAYAKPTGLFYFPVWLLKLFGRATGLNNMVARLVDSLRLDISKVKTKLNWQPKISFSDAIAKTIE